MSADRRDTPSGQFAELRDPEYRLVKTVDLPSGERPWLVLDQGRVYVYYEHTTMVGAPPETVHPYRETRSVYNVGSRLVLP